jgi:CRP/FNR family transcriptional regulator
MMKATTAALTPDLRASRDAASCLDCAIRHHAICAHCSGPELEFLTQAKSYRTLKPGESVVAMGERTGFLGSVVEGVASMSRLLADGRRQVVGLLFPGDFVGRAFSPVAPFDVVAVTEMRLCTFQRAKFEKMVREMPSLEHRMLEMALDELDSAREWMVLLGRKTAQEKLASFFVLAAQRGMRLENRRPIDGMMLELPLTREDMADFLGLTIETVSRQIGALKKSGVVELVDARHMLIPDWEALVDAAGGELETV